MFLDKNDKELMDYLNILDDAAHQRNPESYKDAKNMANCIYDVIMLLKKYKMNKVDEIVHVLTSVIVIPIQMLEQDPHKRSKLMKELATSFTLDIMATQVKDNMMSDTEIGHELDRLRNYTAGSSFGKK